MNKASDYIHKGFDWLNNFAIQQSENIQDGSLSVGAGVLSVTIWTDILQYAIHTTAALVSAIIVSAGVFVFMKWFKSRRWVRNIGVKIEHERNKPDVEDEA